MKNLQDSYVLSNGVKIPCIGFGTWQTPDGDVADTSVKEAIKAGYRHIDTAAAYGNEESIGKAVRECGVPREDLFVTSKLWNTEQGYDAALKAFEATMERLGLEYLDLYLIHWPRPIAYRDNYQEINANTWRAFEKLYREGRVRAIGVSNFMPHHLEPLMAKAEIMPMVNQIELHPGFPQDETVAFCKAHHIVVEAWSPLMQGKVFALPLLQEIADRYQKSIAQICVRWSLQQGYVPLPKSVHVDRIKNNAEVFDFEISPKDMEKIYTLHTLGRVGSDPDHAKF